MAKSCECPKCGADISESYEPYDPSVGIMSGGWFCNACDLAIMDEGDDVSDDWAAEDYAATFDARCR